MTREQLSLDNLRDLIRVAVRVVDQESIENKPNVAQLLAGTAAVESDLVHRSQFGGGPARGIWQMEPSTAVDIFKNYLCRPDKADLWKRFSQEWFGETKPCRIPSSDELACELETNDTFSVLMARVLYFRRPEAIPPYNNISDHAKYWKQHYNTRAGRGTVEKYMEKWERYNLSDLI